MHPYFSVILPIYNVEPYLERCIQSILMQTFNDYEMILVDDGSTDESGRICDTYADKYDHIRVVHKENGGLSSSRNAGMGIARGEYIWWVDADDWVEKHALSQLYDAVNDDKPDIVKFNYVRVADTETSVLSSATPGKYTQKSEIDMLLRRSFVETSKFVLSAWSHLYKREFLQREDLCFVSEREIGSEDYLFNLQALLVASQIVVIKDTLYFYELRMGSLSQRYKENAPQKYTALYMKLRSFYNKREVLKEYEYVINRFFIWHLIHGICISNEYTLSEKHRLPDARKNVVEMLAMQEIRRAIRRMDISGLSWKQKLHVKAIKFRTEPFFCWLYVSKSKQYKV